MTGRCPASGWPSPIARCLPRGPPFNVARRSPTVHSRSYRVTGRTEETTRRATTWSLVIFKEHPETTFDDRTRPVNDDLTRPASGHSLSMLGPDT